MKTKYYSLKNILDKNAIYNVIFGERSNGKTYSVLKYGLDVWKKTGGQLAIIRRMREDFTGKRGSTMFNALVVNKEIEKTTDGEYNDVYYYGGKWYFCRYDEKGKRDISEKPFAYGFSLTTMEHDKSTSYPEIQTILFDEFMTRDTYLTDEFVLFMNTISTIIRDRANVKIFMCGNTVNKYCPYFSEMGLTHIKDMQQGSIDVYTYGNSGLTVAVEFSDNPNKCKASDKYFAFDNPKLSMITGNGNVWEMDIYPHAPCKYKPKDIQFSYFIMFDGNILQCDIVVLPDFTFTFIHIKTTKIQNEEKDLIFTPDYNPRPNWRRNIKKPYSKIEEKISDYFYNEKVFYQDNEVGEIVRNYLEFCKQ